MVLQGEYEDLRQFIYSVESSPEFVIIDDVALTEAKPNEPQTLTIRMSTYYRLDRSGAGS
jgi:Tfp pilus assembly protein PilO